MTIAPSSGGRRAATWRALNPAHELPIMPTFPEHHGWRASQAIAATASLNSWGRYSSTRIPSDSPEPRISRRTPAIPVTGEIAVERLVVDRGEVALAIRVVLDDGGDRVGLGVGRQEDAGGHPLPVRQRDPDVLELADLAREVVEDPHRGGSKARWSVRSPRLVMSGRTSGRSSTSGSRRRPGSRRTIVSTTICAWSRASGAPRQK